MLPDLNPLRKHHLSQMNTLTHFILRHRWEVLQPHDTPYTGDVKLIFTGGHISLEAAFKGPNVILGLYKCNYSLTRGKELGAAAR